MDKIVYHEPATHWSYLPAETLARTLTHQGVKDGRNIRKDVSNSAPGVGIFNTTLERTEVSGGVTYHIYVVTFTVQKRSDDGKTTVETKATLTLRVPQAVISNTDITKFASAFISVLYTAGTTNSGSTSTTSTTLPSQLEQIMLGSI